MQYRSLIGFVTSNHVQPNPKDVIPPNAARHATGVRRVEKLDAPPTEPRLFPTSAIFPDGVPKEADMFEALRKSAVKSLGSSAMYTRQFKQLQAQIPYKYTQAEALSCHNITGNPEFTSKLKMFHPLGPWPEGERATTTNNTFSILPAKAMQDLTVDIAANMVCSISGVRVWLLAPPGGPQFYKDWAAVLSTDTPGAVMWSAFGTRSPLIAVTEADGDALYIPPGWRYCSYSLEGGYDASIRVVYESSQFQAACIWVRMFQGVSPGGDRTISDGVAKSLIRCFRAVLRSMTSGLRQEDTFRTVDMLRDVLGCEASEMKALGWGNRNDDDRRWGVLMAYWKEEVGAEWNREYLVNKREKAEKGTRWLKMFDDDDD